MAQPVLTSAVGVPPADIAFDDIQGIVRFGYAHLTEASFTLLRIADAAAARAWLAATPVTSAKAAIPLPDTALQIAFTCEGLRRIGLGEDAITGFSAEFISGMAGQDNRSRRLGDIGDNSPALWRWGGPGRAPHLVVMLYARPGGLAAWSEAVEGALWASAFSVMEVLSTHMLGADGGVRREPFGFVDGISQPDLDWQRESEPASLAAAYGNRAALGEFLLGYPNEYGIYTDRPLLDPAADSKNLLPRAEDDPAKRDLGHNGTFLVLRDLRQDVRGFWQYLERQANAIGLARRRLAEAMVGRTMSGTPLMPAIDRQIAGVEPSDRLNRFTFQTDPYGIQCPLGAHIRRANPRNADLPDGATGWLSRLVRILGFGTRHARDDLIASARFHRLLRRGRPYGNPVSDDEALQPGLSDEEVGLRFVCLNANISRQFEFVQTAWVASTKFGGLTQESDPLLGNRQPVASCPMTGTFSLPQPSGAGLRLRDVPQFVTVRGGAYFFLPSLSALHYLANLGE
jgi:deferrochelatase/peroxidase EfeB